MKKDFETHLYDVGQKVSMTSLEKEAILGRLKETMKTQEQPLVSTYTTFSFFGYQRMASLAFAFLILVGGVTSASAEYSFPGDSLYFFKVGVNEQVRGWFSNSPIAKAEWSIRLAERRLYELESIQGDSTLSMEMRKSLEDKFTLQVDKADQNTQAYEIEDISMEDTGAESVSLLTTSVPAPEAASFSARSVSEEPISALSQGEEKNAKENMEVRTKDVEIQADAQMFAQIEDLEDRIRTLRKTLRNAKAMESLDRGRILRLEARLLQSQRMLIALKKEDTTQAEQNIISIKKSIFDIEQTLDAMILVPENTPEGEVLGGSVDTEREEDVSSQKEDDVRKDEEDRDLFIEKPRDVSETLLKNEDR